MKTVLKGKQRLSNLSNPTVNLQSQEKLFFIVIAILYVIINFVVFDKALF